MKSLSRSTFTSAFWMINGAVFQAILKIYVLVVLARFITPEEFGIVNAALVIIAFSMLFTEMGVGPAIVQRSELTKLHISTGIYISFLFGILVATTLFVISDIFARFFEMDGLGLIIKVLSITFIIKSLMIVPLSLLERNLKFKIITIINVLSYAISYGILGIILAINGFGAWALIYGYLSKVIFSSLFYIYYSNTTFNYKFSIKCAKDLLYYGGGFTLTKIGNYFALQGDNIVIAKFMNATALGIYGRAYQFMVMPVNLLANALNKVLFPAMSSIQQDRNKLRSAFLKGNFSFALISLPVSIFIYLYAEEIVSVFLGNQWDAVIEPLQILSIGLFFRMGYKVADSMTKATGLVYQSAGRQYIYATNILLFTWIGHFWDLTGVAIGVVLALFFHFVLMMKLSLKKIDIDLKEFALSFTLPIKLGVFSLVYLYLFQVLIGSQLNDLFTLLFSFLSYIIIVGIGILNFRDSILDKHGIWMVDIVKEYIPNRFKAYF